MVRSTYSINGLFEFGSITATKIVAKTFQNKNVDMVDVVTYISQTKKKQLERIERKDFESLPTICRFLNDTKEEEEKHLFQDIKLKRFRKH